MNITKFSVTFSLTKRDIDVDKIKSKPVNINAILRFNSVKVRFYNVHKIVLGKYKIQEKKDKSGAMKVVELSDTWDFEKQLPKTLVVNSIVTRRLNEVTKVLSDQFLAFCAELGRFPDDNEAKALHTKINAILKNKPLRDEAAAPKTKTNNLLVYMAEYINDATSSPAKRLMKGKQYQKRSVQSFLNTLNILSEYRGGSAYTFKDLGITTSLNKLPYIPFSDINMDFYESFRAYLGGRGLSVSYFGSQIKYLKKFCNEAMIEGYHSSVEWKDRRFIKQSAPADNEALSIAQLKALGAYDFSGQPVYDNARDLFLLGCWTGLRYSDYSRLTRDHIDGIFIDIHTKKTSEQVTIPILKELRRILDKYIDTTTGFPRAISDVKLNVYIKEICRIVGENSDSSFLKVKTVVKSMIDGACATEQPLYERVSTHTGRRSFATNAIRLQIPKSTIMKITGHKTESAFDAYVKIESRENASILASHFSKLEL